MAANRLRRTSVLSMHSKTHLDVVKVFLPIETAIEEEDAGTYLVRNELVASIITVCGDLGFRMVPVRKRT